MSKSKSQREKENPKRGFYDRLLLRGLCDNAKRKGKFGGKEKP